MVVKCELYISKCLLRPQPLICFADQRYGFAVKCYKNSEYESSFQIKVVRKFWMEIKRLNYNVDPLILKMTFGFTLEAFSSYSELLLSKLW